MRPSNECFNQSQQLLGRRRKRKIFLSEANQLSMLVFVPSSTTTTYRRRLTCTDKRMQREKETEREKERKKEGEREREILNRESRNISRDTIRK